MSEKKGKILILKLKERVLSILIHDNQILSVQVQKQNVHEIGNIYVGRVQSVSESIGAAFVDLGSGYLTFLPLAEAWKAHITNRQPDGRIRAGDEILVQIVKEPMKTKLAGVTASVSLSGKYVVVGCKGGGSAFVQISSKLSKKYQYRFRKIEALQQIAMRYGLIVRTNAGALECNGPLIEEAQFLAKQMEHIVQIAGQRTCYSCLYRGKPEYLHFIENAYTSEYDEIITDIPEIYAVLKENHNGTDVPVRFYEDAMLPLYKLYSVEARIGELLAKKVWLKSGGYLIIEPTEALISIDVNSGKYENGKDKEETALRINLEAAKMIAIHLRARNLSGMILVDFINLRQKTHEQQLIEYMRSLLKKDNVTADVVDMTGLGLMEITRKKVNPSFKEQYTNA